MDHRTSIDDPGAFGDDESAEDDSEYDEYSDVSQTDSIDVDDDEGGALQDTVDVARPSRDVVRRHFIQRYSDVHGQPSSARDDTDENDINHEANGDFNRTRSPRTGPTRSSLRNNFMVRLHEVGVQPLLSRHKKTFFDPTSKIYPAFSSRTKGKNRRKSSKVDSPPLTTAQAQTNVPSSFFPQTLIHQTQGTNQSDVPLSAPSPAQMQDESPNSNDSNGLEPPPRPSSPEEVARMIGTPEVSSAARPVEPGPSKPCPQVIIDVSLDASEDDIDVDDRPLMSPTWGDGREDAFPTPPLVEGSQPQPSNEDVDQSRATPSQPLHDGALADTSVSGSAGQGGFSTSINPQANIDQPTSSTGKRKRSDSITAREGNISELEIGGSRSGPTPPDIILMSPTTSAPKVAERAASDDSTADIRGESHKPFPREVSDLLVYLTRTVGNVVTRAFEEGISNGRIAFKKANEGSTQNPGGAFPSDSNTSQPGANAGNDGPSGTNPSGDSSRSADPDLYPKMRGKQRRQRGKRKEILNTFHLEIRTFLELHGVYPPKDDPHYFPPSVSDTALERFRLEGKTAGPSVNDPENPFRLNWKCSLTRDPWNAAAIRLLVHRLHTVFALRQDKKKFEGLSTDQVSLRKMILSRLSPIKTAICKADGARQEDGVRARARMRRASRRMNRNTLRNKILAYQKRKHKRDSLAKTWEDAAKVAYILDGNGRDTGDGCSEDGTETEEDGKVKVVRVLRRDWINKDIPKLMHAVDTYAQDSLDDVGRQHQGNSSFIRRFPAKDVDKRKYMTGLPRNFYDDDWYKGLDEEEKCLVQAEERVVNIPELPPYARNSPIA